MAEYLDYEGLREYTELIRKYTQPWVASLPNVSSSNDGRALSSGSPGYFPEFDIVKDYFTLASQDEAFYAPLILHIDGANLNYFVDQIILTYDKFDDCGHALGEERYEVSNIRLYFPTEYDPSYSSSLSGTFALYRTDSNTWYAVGYGTQLYPKDVTALKTTLSQLHSGGIS